MGMSGDPNQDITLPHSTEHHNTVGNPAQKKAKQILAQARKTSANNNSNVQLISNLNS